MPSSARTLRRNSVGDKHMADPPTNSGGNSINSANSSTETNVVVPFAADVASGLGIEINTSGAAILATNRIDAFAAVAGKTGENSAIQNTGTIEVTDATFDIGKVVWFLPGQTPNTTTTIPRNTDTIKQSVGVAIEATKILINIQRERTRV
jgi:hypothetical protein